jgi:uncharacterized protein
MKMPLFHYSVVFLLACLACGPQTTPQEEARIKLTQMNLDYTGNVFVERARDGDLLAVKLFLQAGMSPNTQGRQGTPLLAAAANGRLEIAEVLLEHGADLNIRDTKKKATPLLWATLKGHADLVNLLLDKGADLSAAELKTGMTPLLTAANQGNVEIARILLARGADIKNRDKEGRNPLVWAAYNGHAPMVRFLVERGVDLQAVNDRTGLSALHYAAMAGRPEAVAALLAAGADINVRDRDGKTPLVWAVSQGKADTVRLLLDKGADLRPKDDQGKTALDWAAGKQAIQEMLKEARR